MFIMESNSIFCLTNQAGEDRAIDVDFCVKKR